MKTRTLQLLANNLRIQTKTNTKTNTRLIPRQDHTALSLPHSITNTLENLVDPFKLLATELHHLKQNIKNLIGSNHSRLDSIAKYYFASPQQGKLLRPLIILLISQATAANRDHTAKPDFQSINQSISSLEVLNDTNPTQSDIIDPSVEAGPTHEILPTQRRLAEIAELIHVSSLLHDDVIDEAEVRRGRPAAPCAFGSKLSVLAGDFLLSRASVALSRLGNFEVIELVSSIISNLVEGELVQLESIIKPTSTSATPDTPSVIQFDPRLFEFYERKNFLKTASLMAKTCRSAVILSNPSSASQNLNWIDSSYRFGKHFGLAFQIVDDILDYTSTEEKMGKTSSLSDLKSGLVTGPGLFAWQNHGPSFGELVHRKFSGEGDLDLAQKMVQDSGGIERSYELARAHLAICKAQLARFPASESVDGLDRLCTLVLDRKH